jgi:hypothetical protein
MREERQLATRLQAANVDLYDRYDRLLAESSFRINVTPPLLALLLILLWQTGIHDQVRIVMTVAIVLGVGFFLRQGVRRAMRSRDIIVQSVTMELVTPRFLSRNRDRAGDAEQPS